MHDSTLHRLRHSHNYLPDSLQSERGTFRVMLLTAVMMVAEIFGGFLFGSMALLADGWHMATHVTAFGIAVFAYRYARRNAENPRFTFGTGKVGVLGGFASSIALAVVALVMAAESLQRMVQPGEIRFDEAIGVAVAGLAVNLASGWILSRQHARAHAAAGGDTGRHRDHNLRAAYMHVVADALTSVFAIVALLAGKVFGWAFLDPVMGLVGAAVISRWSFGLIRETSPILVDGVAEADLRSAIRAAIENDADNRLADLHLWHIGPDSYAVGLAIVSDHPQVPEHYRGLLQPFPQLVHILVEVDRCAEPLCSENAL